MNNHKIAGLPISGPAAGTCTVANYLKDLRARCREGKQDKNLVIHTGIADAQSDIECLNRKAASALSYRHLEVAERSLPDVAFRYVSVYKDGDLVLFVYFQLFTLTARSFNLHLDKSVAKHILSLILDLKKAKVLVLGNALRTEARSFCYDHEVFSEEQAWDAIAAVADSLAITESASAVILNGATTNSRHAAKNMTAMGYSMPLEDLLMEMNVNLEWNSLQDYTAALTRKYKTRAAKVLEAGKQLSVKPLSVAETKQCQPAISRLFGEVTDKQPFLFTRSGAEYIVALKELYKDEFEVMGFYDGTTLVAFYSAFITEDAYELFYVGFDTALNTQYQLYFNLMLAGLGQTIALRKASLKLGRTSFDAKASLGAKPVRANYLIKFRQIPDVAIKWLTTYFSAMEDTRWRQRNPMKD
jgi:hypothetical protein